MAADGAAGEGVGGPRISVRRLAARRFGRQPLGVEAAAITASEGRPPARSADGHKGVLRGCVPAVRVLKYFWNLLYS